MTTRVMIAGVCLALANSIAAAEDETTKAKPDVWACAARPPLECYLGNTNFALLSCRLTGSNALLKYSMGDQSGLDEVKTCIADARRATERSFADAKVALSKNDRALTMLKDHYAAFLTAVGDLFPGGTSERAYTAKAQVSERRIKEMGIRVKLEE